MCFIHLFVLTQCLVLIIQSINPRRIVSCSFGGMKRPWTTDPGRFRDLLLTEWPGQTANCTFSISFLPHGVSRI